MAYKPMYRNGNGDFQDEEGVIINYICDSDSDVASLPTGVDETDWTKRPRPGSCALIADTFSIYVLNPSRQWVTTN